MTMGEDKAATIRALFRRSSVNRIAEHPIRMARTELFDKFVGLPEHVLRMTNIVSSKFVGVQKNGFGHRLRQDTKLRLPSAMDSRAAPSSRRPTAIKSCSRSSTDNCAMFEE